MERFNLFNHFYVRKKFDIMRNDEETKSIIASNTVIRYLRRNSSAPRVNWS